MRRYILIFVNIVSRFFTALTLLFAIMATITDFSPDHSTLSFTSLRVVKIFIAACCFGGITVIRISLENKKWMLCLSFIQKRWIFFPAYLIVMILFIASYGMLDQFGFLEATICSVLFLTIAGLFTVIASKKYRSDKRKFTEAIVEYRKKIGKK